MKTVLFVLLAEWFLVTYLHYDTGKVSRGTLKLKTTRQVDSVFTVFKIPYKADSLFITSPFLEVRRKGLEFYIEKKKK